jgi:hypothetical protein
MNKNSEREEDAMVAWCPFAAIVQALVYREQEAMRRGNEDHCKGCGCLMWRMEEEDSNYGYCGLAGL